MSDVCMYVYIYATCSVCNVCLSACMRVGRKLSLGGVGAFDSAVQLLQSHKDP